MQGVTLLVITFFILAVALIAVTLNLIQGARLKRMKREVESLETEKNLVASTPVMSELSKVEAIIKNDKMEEKYRAWQERFEWIKEDRLMKVNDMIIDLDMYLEKKDYKNSRYKIAKAEMELYKARSAADHLLEEIREVTRSDEKYRSIITKLKAKYRELMSTFQEKKAEYDPVTETIELQFENIEKRFMDFEVAMDQNEYSEVVHIVKALDAMIDHITIVVDEVPNLVLMSLQLIPKRMEQIQEVYQEMVKDGYPLDYLKIDYNLEESRKHVNDIMDRVKVLNLEEAMFELKTMLDYLDSLFHDFEKERLARKVYEEIRGDFEKKIKKINKIVEDIYKQLDDIKNMYDLTDEDVKVIDTVNGSLLKINLDYKSLTKQVKEKEMPYSKSHQAIEELSTRLKELEEELDQSLRSLGSMYDDEVRAREQLEEIQELLKQCKMRIRSYKLPIITDNYFVQLSEANDAILEIIKELSKKPIVIRILNTRVDTARDLVLKLFNTTNEMIRTAEMAEKMMVYGNRYRSYMDEVDKKLDQAQILFFKGNYQKALETSIGAVDLVEPGVYKRLLEAYEK